MANGTLPCLACWPCVELLRQYELLRVRCHYEDACGSFMHREVQRARSLLCGKTGIDQQAAGGSCEKAPFSQDLAFLEDQSKSFRELTPRESFNRWLMERRSVPARHVDPLIPSIWGDIYARKALAQVVEGGSLPSDGTNGSNEILYAGTSGKADSIADAEGDGKSGVESDSDDITTPEPLCAIGGSTCGRSSTGTLEREILEDLPMKIAISPTAEKSREHLTEYARAVGSIMLEEKQTVEKVSLAALSPLVDALLMLLRGERGASVPGNKASLMQSSRTSRNVAADLLFALASELSHWRSRRSSVRFPNDAGGNNLNGQEHREAASRDTHVLSNGDYPRETPEGAIDFSIQSGCRHEPLEDFWERKAAGGKQESCSSNTSSVGAVTVYRSTSRIFTDGPPEVAATDYAWRTSSKGLGSFSKDDVYFTVCLAKPVLRAIYGDKVRALVKSVEEEAQQAATRVARYAACVALAHAAEAECSAPYSDTPIFDAVEAMDTCGIVQSTNCGNAVASPDCHSVLESASFESAVQFMSTHGTVQSTNCGSAASLSDRHSVLETDHFEEAESPGGCRVLVRNIEAYTEESDIEGGRALLLDTSSASRHTHGGAVKEQCTLHTQKCILPPLGSGCLEVNNIKWISCRRYERFVYVGDVDMVAWDDCQSVRADFFDSFTTRYHVKGYKVVQLWTRYILRKLGRKDDNVARGDCMRTECVCKGKGWCPGEWTCSCVRRQIKRIQSSAYAAEFTVLVFCLLCRYYSVCGCRKQGNGLHSAAPDELMQVLREQVGADCELFASPLNVSLKTYCSLFPDIDVFFGSQGSFFDPNFTVKEGSYEVNPPFEEAVMNRVVSRIEGWLDVSTQEQSESEGQRPLSFCVLVPYWRAGPSRYMSALIRSKYMRFSFVVPEGQHYFLSGFQHFCYTKEIARVSVCKTLFVVLQNEAGARKWPITQEVAKRIEASWTSGRATCGDGVGNF